MSYKTRPDEDDGFGQITPLCREYTLSRVNPTIQSLCSNSWRNNYWTSHWSSDSENSWPTWTWNCNSITKWYTTHTPCYDFKRKESVRGWSSYSQCRLWGWWRTCRPFSLFSLQADVFLDVVAFAPDDYERFLTDVTVLTPHAGKCGNAAARRTSHDGMANAWNVFRLKKHGKRRAGGRGDAVETCAFCSTNGKYMSASRVLQALKRKLQRAVLYGWCGSLGDIWNHERRRSRRARH